MKTNRLFLTIALMITTWCSAMASFNIPTVDIEKDPVDANGYITSGTEITFTANISYDEGNTDVHALIQSYTWDFNDPFASNNQANTVSGTVTVSDANKSNYTISATHTFGCGGYFVSFTYTTSDGETTTKYIQVLTKNSPLSAVITTPNIVCVTPGGNADVSIQPSLTDPSAPLQSNPSYVWTIDGASGDQLNQDYLIDYQGNSANDIAISSQYVTVNFKKYPPSYPISIKFKCAVVLHPPDDIGCKLELAKTITFKQGIDAPVVCSGCSQAFYAAGGAYTICSNSAPIQLGAAPVQDLTYSWATTPDKPTNINYLSATNIANPILTLQPGASGTIIYVVKATGSNGCTNSVGVRYSVNTLSVSLPANVKICKSSTITAVVTGGQTPYTYLWTDITNPSPTGNNTAELSNTTVANPTFTSIYRGIKTFQVKVTDVAGCSVTKSVIVDFKNSNLNSITGPTLNWCTDIHTIYGSQLFSGGTSPYLLNTSGASSQASLTNCIININSPASGSAIVTDGDGCTATSSYTVIGQPLRLTIDKYNTPLSSNFTTLNNPDWGNHRYNVCHTGAPSSIDINFSITGGCGGYTFHWVATTDQNYAYNSPTSDATNYSTITVTQNPSVGTALTANTFTSNLKFQSSAIPKDGYYILYLVAEDGNGSKTFAGVTFVYEQTATPATLTNICNGSTVTTTASNWKSDQFTTGRWSSYPSEATLGSQSESSITLSYANNKLAQVYFEKTNSCGVNSTYTVYGAGPQFTLDAGKDKTICAGGSTTLTANNGSGINYSWSPAAGLSATNVQNPVASPTATTTYTVSNTSPGCSNANTAKVEVYVSNADPSTVATWKRGFLSNFYTPAKDNIVVDKNSNQVYYRTADNNIQSMWFETESQTWQWSGLTTVNNASGVMAISPNGQIFYRTTNNELHSLVWSATNGWVHTVPVASVNNVQGPIVATNDRIFYRTLGNNIQCIYLAAPNQWAYSTMNNVTNGNVNNAMGYNYADGKLYYRTFANTLNCISGSFGAGYTNSNMNNVAGTDIGNSIAFATNGQIFFSTISGGIKSLYMNNGSWAWSGLNYPTNVAGDLVCDQYDRLFYRTNDNMLNYLYWTSANGWQTNTMNNVTSSDGTSKNGILTSGPNVYNNIAVGGNGNVYFKTTDGRIRSVYLEGPCDFKIPNTRDPENPANTINGISFTKKSSARIRQQDTYGNSYFVNNSCSGSGTINTIKFANQSMSCASYMEQTGALISNYTAAPTDNVTIAYTGYIYVPVDGTYAFYLNSDDGSNLFIGNTRVVDNDLNGSHAMQERSGLIALKAGKHAFTVNYKNITGDYGVSLSYEGPSLYKQVIPDNAYFIVSSGLREASTEQISTSERNGAEIAYYPNPFNQSFKVRVKSDESKGENAQLILHNLIGEEVYSTSIKLNREQELFIEGSAGLYIGIIKYTDGSVSQFKVVKE